MSFVGKVLIGVQMVLAVMFMAFAASVATYHQNWKEKADQAEQKANTLQSQIQQLTETYENQKNALTKAAGDEKVRADKFVALNNTLSQQVQTLNQELDTRNKDLQTQTALATINAEEAGFRKEESDLQRVENNKLHNQLDATNKKVLNLEDQIFNAQVENASLEEKYDRLLDETKHLRRVVRINNLETDPKVYAAKTNPPPFVNGLVVDTKKERNGTVKYVEVSLGSDDGLVKGHNLYVYRSGLQKDQKAKYLGKIELVYVSLDRAVGTLVMKAKNGIIEKGDNVTSQL